MADLLAGWGMCGKVKCDFSAPLMGGASHSGLADEDWPQVEMTGEHFDWLMSSPIDDIRDWMWGLLEA